MTVIDQSIVVGVPLHDAYGCWLTLLRHPPAAQAPGSDRPPASDRQGAQQRERDEAVVRVVEQVPDQRITWIPNGSHGGGGMVSFASLGAHATRVSLLVEVELAGALSGDDAVPDRVRQSVRSSLRQFRDLAEAQSTGASAGPRVRGRSGGPPPLAP